jgi:uncharacterized protein involved in type VI secretion and phage assembly
MSVGDRAGRLSDDTVTAQEARLREQLRQACAQHLEDLVRHQRVKLRSLIMADERDELPRAS